MVLRPESPRRAAPMLERLVGRGFRHCEIAWRPGDDWIEQCRELRAGFPSLLLGAASIVSAEGVDAAAAAGFRYAVSPILQQTLLERAAVHGLTLVPGVMTPSEVAAARSWGCRIVKLFPADALGARYWRRLAAPLGTPLPFCIAAGGLAPADVPAWLASGVDAVALGSSLEEGDGRAIDETLRILQDRLSAGTDLGNA